jgi:hypothetical protein
VQARSPASLRRSLLRLVYDHTANGARHLTGVCSKSSTPATEHLAQCARSSMRGRIRHAKCQSGSLHSRHACRCFTRRFRQFPHLDEHSKSTHGRVQLGLLACVHTQPRRQVGRMRKFDKIRFGNWKADRDLAPPRAREATSRPRNSTRRFDGSARILPCTMTLMGRFVCRRA